MNQWTTGARTRRERRVAGQRGESLLTQTYALPFFRSGCLRRRASAMIRSSFFNSSTLTFLVYSMLTTN